jgi:hypothetical protein
MGVTEILISLGLIVVIGGAAYWLATKEQKTMKPGPIELDEQTRQAKREAASSITNVNMP